MDVIYSFRRRDLFYPAWRVTDSTVEYKKHVIPFESIIDAKMFGASNGVFEIKTPTKSYMILFSLRDWDSVADAYYYVLSKCPTALERRIAAEEDDEKRKALEAKCTYSPTPKNKDASVVGRAVASGIITGPVGAVVGALSAVDKNNRKRK